MVTLQLHTSSVLKTNTISEPQVSHGHPPATYIISPENKHDIRAPGEPWSPPATYIISPENKHTDIRAPGEPWSPSGYIHHQSWKQTHWYQSPRWAMVTPQLHTPPVLKRNTLISEPQVSHGHPQLHTSSVLKRNTLISEPQVSHGHPPATYITSPENIQHHVCSGVPLGQGNFLQNAQKINTVLVSSWGQVMVIIFKCCTEQGSNGAWLVCNFQYSLRTDMDSVSERDFERF